MLGLSAFKRKPRQYSYKPIYHDPEQEARDNRKVVVSDEKGEKYVPGKYIKASRMGRIMGIDASEPVKKDKWIRVIIRVVALILVSLMVYALLMSDFISKFITTFKG